MRSVRLAAPLPRDCERGSGHGVQAYQRAAVVRFVESYVSRFRPINPARPTRPSSPIQPQSRSLSARWVVCGGVPPVWLNEGDTAPHVSAAASTSAYFIGFLLFMFGTFRECWWVTPIRYRPLRACTQHAFVRDALRANRSTRRVAAERIGCDAAGGHASGIAVACTSMGMHPVLPGRRRRKRVYHGSGRCRRTSAFAMFQAATVRCEVCSLQSAHAIVAACCMRGSISSATAQCTEHPLLRCSGRASAPQR